MSEDKSERPVHMPEPEPEPGPDSARRFVDDFIDAPPATVSASPEDDAIGGMFSLKDQVILAIKQIYDPEIPVNIYDLGLIYDVAIDDNNIAQIKMTLTSPHCPVAETLPNEVQYRASLVHGLSDAYVELVWSPPWEPSKMSEEAQLELGFL